MQREPYASSANKTQEMSWVGNKYRADKGRLDSSMVSVFRCACGPNSGQTPTTSDSAESAWGGIGGATLSQYLKSGRELKRGVDASHKQGRFSASAFHRSRCERTASPNIRGHRPTPSTSAWRILDHFPIKRDCKALCVAFHSAVLRGGGLEGFCNWLALAYMWLGKSWQCCNASR